MGKKVVLDGTMTSETPSATVLTDSGANLTPDALIGTIIDNETDGSSGVITDNDATTITCAGGLSGGSDNQWQQNDVWSVRTIAAPTSLVSKVWVPSARCIMTIQAAIEAGYITRTADGVCQFLNSFDRENFAEVTIG